MSLIFCFLLTTLIFAILLISSLVKGVTSFVFGKNEYKHNAPKNPRESSYTKKATTHSKIFAKNEGEYISYEEIKED